MGIVTEHLRQLTAKQVNDRSLVVWYDPERYYADVACKLALQDATVECYDGSFFALRHKIEPLMGGYEPPRLVVYVPLEQANTQHALAELEAAGVVMMPGQQRPPAANTRLALVLKKARQRYMETGGKLAEMFVRALREAKFQTGNVLRQTQVFERKVKPLLDGSRIAYVWVDALRYEMGRELAAALRESFDVELETEITQFLCSFVPSMCNLDAPKRASYDGLCDDPNCF